MLKLAFTVLTASIACAAHPTQAVSDEQTSALRFLQAHALFAEACLDSQGDLEKAEQVLHNLSFSAVELEYEEIEVIAGFQREEFKVLLGFRSEAHRIHRICAVVIPGIWEELQHSLWSQAFTESLRHVEDHRWIITDVSFGGEGHIFRIEGAPISSGSFLIESGCASELLGNKSSHDCFIFFDRGEEL